jgi:DNA segregation ATPase FtsK/SpoIIIE-like protein
MQRRELLIEEIGEGSYRLYNQRSKHIMADNITFDAAVMPLVIEFGKASTSLLQRRLRIGYATCCYHDSLHVYWFKDAAWVHVQIR